jgi:S-adenosylmethionine uptake transporter
VRLRVPAPGRLTPIGWILLSTMMFATLAALVKAVADEVSLAAILLARNVPSAIVLGAFAALRGWPLRTSCPRLHLWRCLSGVTGMALGIYAVTHLPLATAATLEYTAPLFLVLGGVLATRRAPRWREAGLVLAGFAGVLLLLRPSLGAELHVPFLAGLGGGALGAMTYRSLRMLGEAGEPGWRIVFFYSLAGSACGLAMLAFSPQRTASIASVLVLAAIGVIGLLAQWTMTLAFRSGPTSLLATIQYSTVVLSVVYGALFWGEQPTAGSLAGLVIIVVSGALAAREIGLHRAKGSG